jgi:hypothetical protein
VTLTFNILLLAGAAAALLVLRQVMRRTSRSQRIDVGEVSEQWLAEHGRHEEQ